MSARSSLPAFSLFKARGQPGEWYGYVRIASVTYKVNAHREGHGQAKHFVGTVKRHLKADQQNLPLAPAERVQQIVGDAINRRVDAEIMRHAPTGNMPDTGFDDDELPEEL